MKVLSTNSCRECYAAPNNEGVRVLLQKKMDSDENIVRQELVRVWTKILEKYARPGVHIPSVEEIRRELLEVGVSAAVSAVVDEHWFVFSWMVEDQIQEKVERGLQRFDLARFVADVGVAQNDPGMKNHLREKIRHYVLFEEF